MPASDPGRGLRWWSVILVGFLHGILTAVAYPPVYWWPFVFAAPLPLIWLGMKEAGRAAPLERPRSRWRRLWRRVRVPVLVAIGALPLWLYEERWLIAVTAPGYIPGAMVMCSYAGIFVGLLAWVRSRLPRVPLVLTSAVLWTGIEVFRGELLFDGYAWLLLAHPLIDVTLLAMPASVLGTYFVSFLVAMTVSGLAAAWLLRGRARVVNVFLVGVFVAVAAGWTYLVTRRPMYGPPVKIAVIQTDVPQSNKLGWLPEEQLLEFERFMELTRNAAVSKPDLIVWPETMFPGILDAAALEELRENQITYKVPAEVRPEGRYYLTEFADRLLELQAKLDIPMVVGAVAYDGLEIDLNPIRFRHAAKYNSAYLIQDGAVAARYDKMQLTPFGEIMPHIYRWPWLQQLLLDFGAAGMSFDLNWGTRPVRLEPTVHGERYAIATPICFEVTDAGVNRALVTAGEPLPAILLNVTNDGWFGSFEGGREQHMHIARWRALELGVPMVRAANTGISSAFDHRGRVMKIGIDGGGAAHVEGIMTVEVRPTRPNTPFVGIGNVFARVCLAAMAILLLAAGLLPVAKHGDPAR